MTGGSFIEQCETYVRTRATASERLIRAAWKVEYALGWRYAETREPADLPVLREFVLIECERTDACHQEIDAATILDHECIGREALDLAGFPLAYRIAALDAAAGKLVPTSNHEAIIGGHGAARLAKRSDVIVSEVARIASRHTRRKNVTLVGALETVISGLQRVPGIHVTASDGNPAVIGRDYQDVVVRPAAETVRLIEESDIAVVTGMVIATETYDEVMAAARSARASLVMFAQTGANLVEPMLASGAEVVISEPYPFCFTGVGETRLSVYRSASAP